MGSISSGIDVASIVQQLMYVEEAPVRALQQQKSDTQNKINAYNSLSSKLQDLQGKIGDLNSAESFAARSASSSNENVLTAKATSAASAGTYQIKVNHLALLDNFASDETFDSATSAIGTGSFDLTVGTTTTTITIDNSNNTLLGLKNAIESSGADVNANIVNDGTGYRLTISSKESGSENAISISNDTLTLADGSTPLSLSRTHVITDVSELDASLTVNGLQVTSSSNQVQGVIEGVTLNLVDTSATTINLTVSNDTDTVKQSIKDFVSSYNSAYGFINQQFTYNANSQTAGVLAGDGLLRRVQSDLAQIVSRSVTGLDGSLTTLRSVGIEVQSDGTLSVNDSKLNDFLDSNFADVKNLFLAAGESADNNFSFHTSGGAAEAGNYEVNITQAAEGARVTSPHTILSTLGVDENLTFTLGNTTSAVALTSTMTLSQIVNALNSQFLSDGIDLTASQSGSSLLVTSNTKGSAVSLTVASDVAAGGTGWGEAEHSGADSATGVDVAGTIGGYEASGAGDVLVGNSGPVTGLKFRYSGTTPSTFSMTLSLGYAEQLERTLNHFTDTVDSPLKDAVDGLEALTRSLDDRISSLQDRLDLKQQYLTDEYSKANEALQQLSQLQAQLNAQLG